MFAFGWFAFELLDGFVKLPNVSSPVKSLNAFNSPPADPIGAKNIETSMQLDDRKVYPVQEHFPFIQAPFLLQWYGHVFLVKQ